MNLCRPGQWIVNDPAESFWKIGLTDILEEGQPPWYVKLANLEDGKIRVVPWMDQWTFFGMFVLQQC